MRFRPLFVWGIESRARTGRKDQTRGTA